MNIAVIKLTEMKEYNRYLIVVFNFKNSQKVLAVTLTFWTSIGHQHTILKKEEGINITYIQWLHLYSTHLKCVSHNIYKGILTILGIFDPPIFFYYMESLYKYQIK